MQIGEFEKLLNKNIKIKSLYSKSFNELNKTNKLLVSLRILFFKNTIYKKYIENNYDVEISFLEGPITTILSSKNNNTKKVAWIHNDINLVFGDGFNAKIKKILNKGIYKKYQKLIFVSNHNLNKFKKCYNTKNEKQVIHNYLNKENVQAKSQEFNANFPNDGLLNFVSVARLVKQKAIGRLITVHKRLLEEGLQHRIYVVGDGPFRSNFTNMINELNISDTFILLGQKENPYPYILQADYFCLLSYYEGLPMVLLEAKTLNKNIIITDTASKEALENYKNKLIVENSVDGIYNGLKETIKNNKNQSKLENNVIYENEEIIEKINKLLGE